MKNLAKDKELPPKGNKCPRMSVKRMNGATTNQESNKNLELSLTLVFFSFWALITPIKRKQTLKYECQRMKGAAVNQGPSQT